MGIFLALVLLISCNLSVSDATYTLATVEHVPEGSLPLLLELMRRIMVPGYGLTAGALAAVIAWILSFSGIWELLGSILLAGGWAYCFYLASVMCMVGIDRHFSGEKEEQSSRKICVFKKFLSEKYVVLPVEALSIPLQQIGRVYRDDREALTEEDIRLLGSIFDMEKLAQYDPSVSDPIKSGFRQDVSKREIFPVLAHKWVDFLESRGAKDDMMSGKGYERTCRYGQDD